MNWLAHVFLSEPDVEFQLGNLLADVVRGSDRDFTSAEFILGARRHKAIDAFTDAHSIVHRSRQRLGSEHRRFSGVLMDVFYDYFLATRWQDYSAEPLAAFTSRFYTAAQACEITLPVPARLMLNRIIEHDLLGQYQTLHGVKASLRRLSMRLTARWHREFALDKAVAALIEHHDALAGDFAEFFPELRAHVH